MSLPRDLNCAFMTLVLASTSVAAQPASQCKMTEVADWPVRSTRGVAIVDGTINGRKIGVMLDTGSGTLILRSATDRLGLTRQEARGYRVFGIGGETHVEATHVDEFTIGEMTRKNWRVMVAGERDFGGSVDVILGEDFFDQIDVEFDLPHNTVRLFQPKDCDGVALAYWAGQGASQVELEPYYNAGRQIIVPVQVNGHPMQAVLDSGSVSSVLDRPVAERLGISPDSPGVTYAGKGGGLGGKSVDFWIGPLPSFAIGNETISDTVIRVADLWKDAKDVPIASHLPQKIGNRPALLLGADFLRAHRVLVAHSQRKLYFTYEGGPVFQTKVGADARRNAPGGETGKPAPAERAGKAGPATD